MFSRIKIKYSTFGLLITLFAVLITARCNSLPSKHPYQNLQSGIKLERPNHWNVTYSERNGVIFLSAKSGIGGNDDLARIQIHGPACPIGLSKFNNPYEEIEGNIQRIKLFYDLNSVKVIEEPFSDKTGDYEVTKATIETPKIVLTEVSDKNPFEDRNHNATQTIRIFQIRDNEKHSVMAYIYQGNNNELNSQAKEIVDSIQFICTDSIEP